MLFVAFAPTAIRKSRQIRHTILPMQQYIRYNKKAIGRPEIFGIRFIFR